MDNEENDSPTEGAEGLTNDPALGTQPRSFAQRVFFLNARVRNLLWVERHTLSVRSLVDCLVSNIMKIIFKNN